VFSFNGHIIDNALLRSHASNRLNIQSYKLNAHVLFLFMFTIES